MEMLLLSDVSRVHGVVCVLGIPASCTKTAELIVSRFEEHTRLETRNRALDGSNSAEIFLFYFYLI